ncbi:hypothetical protein EMCG_05205 [[Emmonsia] crescens]|uniref:Serine/threonine protein kinase n=1 Tax=[Emmonsia] crescens TaxID=73230 RepID=A0A0G2HPV8_9EURO|nr:hypothetical protein EMCG_05205 [Emmonsia crescens UAMH 3008]
MEDGREDPNLILILRGKRGAPADGLGLAHNSERSIVPPVLPQRRKLNPRSQKTALELELEADSDSSVENEERHESLQLTFTKPPTDITRGFSFGTDKKRCDVLLAGQRTRGISGVHFIITLDEQGRLVLKDVSTNQTAVSYDRRGAEHWRRRFKWILFLDNKKQTRVYLTDDFYLDIIRPSHGSCQKQYQANVKAYLEASGDSSLALGGLNVPSQDPTRPRTPIDDPIYLPIMPIGRGAFGTVSKVVDVSTGLTYASKTLSESFDFNNSEKKEFERKEFEKEMQLMKNLVHDHIVKFVRSTERPLQLIMEYMPFGNLRHQDEVHPISTAEVELLLAQGLDALRYMHSADTTHRDIKPENILVGGRRDSFYIKLGDFGFSKKGYSNKVDIWALGVVVLEFTHGIPQASRADHHKAIASAAQEALHRSKNSQLFSMLSRMLQINPLDRPSAYDLFEGKSTIDFSSENSAYPFGSTTPTNRGLYMQSGRVSASPDGARQTSAANMQSPTQKRQRSHTSSNGCGVKRPRNLTGYDSLAQLQIDKTVRGVGAGAAPVDHATRRRLEYSYQDGTGGDFNRKKSDVIYRRQASGAPGSTYSSGKQRERQAESVADPFSPDSERQHDLGADADESLSGRSQSAITRDLTPPDQLRKGTAGSVSTLSNNNSIRNNETRNNPKDSSHKDDSKNGKIRP